MSRRTDNSPAISFFSFQDIITSVTGIMFLVVLILILMLLMRQKPTSPQEQEEIRGNEELKQELARLQEELGETASGVAQIQARLQELVKLNLAESEARLALLNTDLKKLRNENQLIKVKIDQTEESLKQVASAQEDIRQQIVQAKEELDSKSPKEALLSQKIQDTENQLQSIKKTVRFTWQRNFSKKPLLVECGADHIRMGTSNAEIPLASFNGNSPETIMNGLLRRLTQYPASDHYILLLVKPAAFVYAEELSERLRLKGYERGREVLPNDTLQIFRGDQQP